jgi:hypothetical protein
MDTVGTKVTYEAWFGLLRASLTDRAIRSPLGDLLPAFPSEELQRNTTSLAGVQALEQANGFYMDVSEALERSNTPINLDWQIVDFGSCWGRISRFFMRDVALDHIRGVDVERSFVDTCRKLFGTNNFSVCNALPPSDFHDSSINLISAYSVFSHLSEAAFQAWLHDFHRILKPEGIVAFTTRTEAFFNYCQGLQGHGSGLSGYQKALAEMVPAIGNFKNRYQAGEFIFATGGGVAGGGAMNESFYGEAFVSPAYFEHNLKDRFEILEFKPIGSKYDQALFVVKKRL